MSTISEITYNRLLNEQENLMEEKQKLFAIKEAAMGEGDLSENAEYDAASTRLAALTARLMEIDDKISNATPIPYSDSNFLTVGSLFYLTIRDNKGSVVRKRGLYLLDSYGDPFKGTISIDSSIGKAILNGGSKTYTFRTELNRVLEAEVEVAGSKAIAEYLATYKG